MSTIIHDLRAARFALLPPDALERLIAEAARPSARLFDFREQRFALRFGLRSAHEVRFEWRPLDGGLFPMLAGTVRFIQFGPFGLVTLRASYQHGEGAPLRLLSSALGHGPAREALAGAGLAVVKMLKAESAEETSEAVQPSKQRRFNR